MLKKFLVWLKKRLEAKPTPAPAPAPVPAPAPTPVNVPATEVLADMAQIPAEMRAAGFGPARDTVMWWWLSRLMYGVTPPCSTLTDAEAATVCGQQRAIVTWWQDRVAALVARMRANTGLTVTLITNDDLDRCGRSLGKGSMLLIPKDLQDRVLMGTVHDD